jgi:S-adenosyl-L-methionine hydrolase (adenosine-forming)
LSRTAGAEEVGDGRPVGSETVYFLSDYGLADEFVGVVHAVVHRLAPHTVVIDLTHSVPPFDVRAGAEALARAAPHLGPGVALAVVDPGVGGERRGLVLEGAGATGPRWFVGPDNGLLLPAAELGGGIVGAWALDRPHGAAVTFDGRDVFAPVAAHLSGAAAPSSVGRAIALGDLVRLPGPRYEPAGPGARLVRAEVTWVDRFGNVQLAAPGAAVPWPEAGAGDDATGLGVAVVTDPPAGGSSTGAPGRTFSARRVRSFSELPHGALGVLSDGNGRLALVVREGSAAAVTGACPGEVVELTW